MALTNAAFLAPKEDKLVVVTFRPFSSRAIAPSGENLNVKS
jgi:hypothetical protein